VGIGIDTTGSTPLPVDERCVPLALKPEFKGSLAAQAWLWKDHTSYAEAAEITDLAQAMGLPYLGKCGGTYSSEWFWSKILHCDRTAPEVSQAAHTWLECADYIPAFLSGQRDPAKVVRSACAAGHKAMFNRAWGGLPSKLFLSKLSPRLADLRERLYEEVSSSEKLAGTLAPEVAERVGLPAGISIAVGAFDAHMGAVGSGVRPGMLVKIIGTSTCDIMVAPMRPSFPDIPGLCGVADESVLPGMFGLEAGQSAVGDLFNWFVSHLCPPEYHGKHAHAKLSDAAAKFRPGESGLLALDWNNGNRTVLVDPLLTGMLVGQTLHTSAPEVYRALIEATAFGALTIIRRFEDAGMAVEEVVNCGGIAEKSALTMQIYADVCNRPMKISRSGQTCALGAAIFGAVVGGAHDTTEHAQLEMTGFRDDVYRPKPENVKVYERLYRLYLQLHDAFGGVKGRDNPSMGNVMKDLIAIRNQVRGV